MGGSAERQQDYIPPGGPLRLVIPANNASGTTMLPFRPLADNLSENDENIILQAVAGNKYEGWAIITLSDPGAGAPHKPPAPTVRARRPTA